MYKHNRGPTAAGKCCHLFNTQKNFPDNDIVVIVNIFMQSLKNPQYLNLSQLIFINSY